MGNDQSTEEMSSVKVAPLYSTDTYMSLNSERNYKSSELQKSSKTGHIVKADYNGIWRIHQPNKLPPESRHGHFTVEDKAKRIVYIGNGIGKDNQYLFDLWAFSLDTMEWRNIPLHGEILSPRVGTRAVFFNNVILAFGGYAEPDLFNDFYAINPETGEVRLIKTSGEIPAPRSTPIMQMVNNKLYLWGGFNGNYPKSLYVLDFSSLSWTKYKQTVQGRTNVPSVVYKDHILSFGGSKSSGILDINTNDNTVSILSTSGEQPPSNAIGSGLVLVGDYLFFFGGQTQTEGSLVYACNLQTRFWFIFNVFPDNETVSLEDGSISEKGQFLIPTTSSFTSVYDEKNRNIIAFLGVPHTPSSIVHIFDISDALAHINLREDMFNALHLNSK